MGFWVIVIFAALLSIYAAVWIMLLSGAAVVQSAVRSQFTQSWKDGYYSVSDESYREPAQYRIDFPATNGTRSFRVDHEGNIVSGFSWRNIDRDEIQPSNRTRRVLKEYTAQIATMQKLSSNLGSGDDGMAEANNASA